MLRLCMPPKLGGMESVAPSSVVAPIAAIAAVAVIAVAVIAVAVIVAVAATAPVAARIRHEIGKYDPDHAECFKGVTAHRYESSK